MVTKICCKCHTEKNVTEFGIRRLSKDGLNGSCRECTNAWTASRRAIRGDEIRAQERAGRLRNKEKRNAHARELYSQNPEKFKEITRKFRQDHSERVRQWERTYESKHKEQYKIYRQNWVKKNPERKRENERNYYHRVLKFDEFFRLNKSMRTAIGMTLRGNKCKLHWEDLVGYTLEELISHLEQQFTEGISWDNYGKGPGKWSIDHKLPISAHQFTSYDDEEFKKCWSLKNLQPLWSVENSRKKDKIMLDLLTN